MLRFLAKGRRIGNRTLSPLHRSFSIGTKNPSASILPRRKIWPWVVGISTATIGGCGLYLYKSSSVQVLEYAKHHADSSTNNLRWRETIAAALIDICSQESGRDMILRHHWGSTLGNWIVDDAV